MCGRFTLHTVREALAHRFAVSLNDLELRPRYNIAPTQSVLTVVADESGERQGREMQWGLIPPWEPEPRTKLSTINARIEGVSQSRLYRGPLERRRCLILADGYYEWQAPSPSVTPDQSKVNLPVRRAKQPHWIHRLDGEPFAFAGIYSLWRAREDPEALPLWSCSLLTTVAFASLRSIHARMPIILQRKYEADWIDPSTRHADELMALLTPAAEESLTHHPVKTLVNSPRHEGPELILDAPQAGF